MQEWRPGGRQRPVAPRSAAWPAFACVMCFWWGHKGGCSETRWNGQAVTSLPRRSFLPHLIIGRAGAKRAWHCPRATTTMPQHVQAYLYQVDLGVVVPVWFETEGRIIFQLQKAYGSLLSLTTILLITMGGGANKVSRHIYMSLDPRTHAQILILLFIRFASSLFGSLFLSVVMLG